MPRKPLLTPKQIAELPKLYSTEKVPTKEKVVVQKFFGGGRFTYYVIEGEREGDDVRLFGYCVSPLGPDCDELGYMMLSEIQGLKFPPFGLPAERDLYWKPTKIGELVEGL